MKKRKLKIGRVLLCLFILGLFYLGFYLIRKLPITNIYITGNSLVPEEEILELSNIKDYPSFIDTSTNKIINKIKSNKYIKEVKVDKKFWGKVYISIKEKKVLCMYDNKLLLEDNTLVDNTYNEYSYPILISQIDDILGKFTSKFSYVNKEVLQKISEIEYTPNDVDDERFKLMMNDGNIVYITLTKVKKINKYNSIYSSMNGKKGIIYLDSGDYIEIKEN